MLEKLKEIVNNAVKKQDENNLIDWPLEDVQGLFGMKHVNDWLKFNAMNERQIENALSFEKHLNNLIKNLYVPDYQSENV